MTKAFLMKLIEMQPSQLYITSEKLSAAMKTFDFARPESIEPVPIKKLGDEITLTDGHTRAFAAFCMVSLKFQFVGKMRNLTGKNMKSACNGANKMGFTP